MTKNNKIIIVSVIASIFVGAAVLIKKEGVVSVPIAKNYVINHSIENLQVLKHISASVVLGNGKRFESQINEDMIVNSNIVSFTNKVGAMPSTYVVTYRIEKENFDIVDITLSVSDNRVKANIENVSPGSSISLVTKQKSLYKDVPADWAGKLELISITNKQDNMCVEILDNNKAQSICHSIEEERQAA